MKVELLVEIVAQMLANKTIEVRFRMWNLMCTNW